jgi:hypothetical protein
MINTIFGTCDGTGAAINVCLGFVPSFVKVWNMEHANEKSLEWFKAFVLMSAMDEGISLDNSVIAPVTANGIAPYAGGDVIAYDKTTHARWELLAVGGATAEETYVDGSYVRTAGGDAAYRCIGDKIEPNKNHGSQVKTTPGFIIGTNGINVDGEQLCWMAIR